MMTTIRAALETALVALGWPDQTAWENKSFNPTAGTPYQRATLLQADPDDSEIGAPAMERGYLQVDLFYPTGDGPGAADTRARLLRSTFYRGRSLPFDGGRILIHRTASILPGYTDVDRYVVPVRIFFRT
jgi:hypothetical protein